MSRIGEVFRQIETMAGDGRSGQLDVPVAQVGKEFGAVRQFLQEHVLADS
jgi:hypothetical protein